MREGRFADLVAFDPATIGATVIERVLELRRGRRNASHRVGEYQRMEMTLRFEIFPADLDVTVDFYVRVLGFAVSKDQRHDPVAYVALQRGDVRVGALRADGPAARAARRPPTGVELVLEVDDVGAERDRLVAAGWPLDEDLQLRPWGMTDFRFLDPDGYYLRITDRAGG